MKRKSGKGFPPQLASYFTGSDHRRQVEAAETRMAKKKIIKQRRNLDKDIIKNQDESMPDDIPKTRK